MILLVGRWLSKQHLQLLEVVGLDLGASVLGHLSNLRELDCLALALFLVDSRRICFHFHVHFRCCTVIDYLSQRYILI